MTRRARQVGGHALLAGLLAGGLLLAVTAPAATAPDLHSLFRDQLEAAGIPGGAHATAAADGTVDAVGVGVTGDGEAVTADTRFVIGSTTKSFTALAVGQLVDDRAVGLDDPVRRYVPELRLAAGEPADAITVRHVLQHTSGLDDLAGGRQLASAVDGTALDAVAELDGTRLAGRPGASWRYANVNYVLAGLVVERASGRSYADHLQLRILEPLGMTRTVVGEAADVAPGQQWYFGLSRASGPERRAGVVAAGYLASTSRDLGRYLAMLLRGGTSQDGTRIISERTLRTLMTPGPDVQMGPWADGAQARYAMGWMVGGPWATPAVFHPGNSPDSSAMLALFPQRGLAVASLVPAGHELPLAGNPSLPDRVSRNLISAALDEPVPALPSLTPFYAAVDAVAVLLLVAAGWSLTRAVRSMRRCSPRTGRGIGAANVARAVPAALGAAVLLWLPTTSYGWLGMWVWAPDLAQLLGVLVTVLSVSALVRLVDAALPGRRHRGNA